MDTATQIKINHEAAKRAIKIRNMPALRWAIDGIKRAKGIK